MGQMKKRARPHTQVEINEYRRQLLIEGTIKSMAELGVGGTTVRSICAGAGSSRGLIGHYYANKEELVAEAFRHLFTTVSRQVMAAQARVGGTALDRLNAIPRFVFSPPVFSDLNRSAFLAFWHEIRFNPAVRKVNGELYLDYTKRTQALFAQAAAQLDIEIDHRSAAIGLVALIDGLWLELSIDDKVVSRRKAIELCLRYIDQQFGLSVATKKRDRAKRTRAA
jgi:TetR/AcrR family transcriptional regulator, transcriptional repressor of bet genes